MIAAYRRIMRDIEENCRDIEKVKSVGSDKATEGQ